MTQKKKRYFLKILLGVFVILLSIVGWKAYQIYSVFSDLLPSQEQLLGLFDNPIVKEEYYSPDSTMKLGAYRFLVPGDGSFNISDTYISVVDTSKDYPRQENIFLVKDSIPEIRWKSKDSVFINLNYSSPKKINGVTIIFRSDL